MKLIQTGWKTLCSESHIVSSYIFNKEELPQRMKKSVILLKRQKLWA